MIIKKIKLFPFARISDREIVFEKGLNVISGPSGSGKSTIVSALTLVLFTPTNLTPAIEKNMLASFLPAGGKTDTIKVTLEFEANSISYLLEKSWGGTKSSKLTVGSSGNIISDPATVQTKIQEVLVHNEATWKNILFAHQAALDKTIEMISRESEISNSFSDILRGVLAAESDQVFNPYYEKTKSYFSKLTAGKYFDINMDKIIPSSISDGQITLRAGLLSQGTKDSLALALRLSMADYYLGHNNGFIVMDDPLTAMDVERQKLAAICIQKFSNEKQVLLFTCNEAHEKILKGNSILLN